MEIKNICVIGAGTMGNGIAHVFALNGFKVEIFDKNSSIFKEALLNISKNLDRQVAKSIISIDDKEKCISNITFQDNIDNVDKNTDLIIEAIYENKDTKSLLFKDITKIIKDKCIISTNTSSISITELSQSVKCPDKFIGMHFMNPVPVMKLVEIIRGYSTSDDTFNNIRDLVIKLDKTPVEVLDYPGFISNRILIPMINEAIFALMEGIASKEDIDTVMKLGMNHPMGPLTLADFIGLDVCLSIMEVLYNGFNDSKYRPCPLLKKMVAANKLGRKTGEGFYKY
jgi:3-hydroxybutyryl-CoA dehydrogenase